MSSPREHHAAQQLSLYPVVGSFWPVTRRALSWGMTRPQVELRVYADFSEVRTQVETTADTLEFTFPQGVWEHVLPASLGVLELPYSSVTHAEAPSWLVRLEGQRVSLRLDPLAPLREATLVRAADLLVQDENAFYRVREDQLVFHELPREKTQNAARDVVSHLKEPGEGVLTYLTRGVKWHPRYTLDATPDSPQATLSALADITNETDGLHAPDALELISGDVQMELGEDDGHPQVMYAMSAGESSRFSRAAPELEELPELGGLYRYNVLNPPPLAANSTVSVAFLPDAFLALEREARLDTHFVHVGAQRGNFNRGYTLTAAHNLPGGRLTIREDGRIVGQHELSETPADHPIRFVLGRDPDVTFQRTLRQTGAERDPDGSGQVRRVSYEVTFSVINSKSRPVQAVINEQHHDRVVTIQGADLQLDNRATLTATLEAGESLNLSYAVTVDR